MRLLLIDDEAPARAKLRRLLQAQPGIAELVEAADGLSALALLQRERFDGAFLDIEMPGLDGLSLAQQLPTGLAWVFCTAHQAHALQAFDLGAADYLLKPYTPERLAAALQRLRQQLLRPEAAAAAGAGLRSALQQQQPIDAHWLVEQRGALVKLPIAAIEWVAAADNYIELHAPPQHYLERRSLASFLAQPAAQGFVRVHRCHAVNAAHIQRIQPLPHGEAELTLSSGQTLRVSRGYRDQLRG